MIWTVHSAGPSSEPAVNLDGNTAEDAHWRLPTPKFVSSSNIAPSHSKQQTRLYDHPSGLNTALLTHFETSATSLSSPAEQRPNAVSGAVPSHAQHELLQMNSAPH